MKRVVVRRGRPLEGRVEVSGAKNSVLKLMAATLLAEGVYTLANVPRIVDVEIMSDVLVSLGSDVHRTEEHVVRISTPATPSWEAPYELVEQMRASIVVLGPLLARLGKARVAVPGGDNFGPRPIDMHLKGLETLGARFIMAHGYIEGRCERLRGGRVVLEFPSVGATENLLLAAVAADGVTVIDNAAREPEIADLADFLAKMGARIDGAGSSTLEVEGVDRFTATDHTVIPDRIEAGTFLAAVGVASGQITLDGARPDHLDMLITKLTDMGMSLETTDAGLKATVERRLRSVDVSTLPYPGVATDYKPFFTVLLSVADGVGIITENLFAGRFAYVDELVRMGADIRTEGHHAVVRGVECLSGAPVRAPDIRAGAALVVAGLGADGETVVSNGHHIDRGYEDLPGKLRALGADARAM